MRKKDNDQCLVFFMEVSEGPLDNVSGNSSERNLKRSRFRVAASLIVAAATIGVFSFVVFIVGILWFPNETNTIIEWLFTLLIIIIDNISFIIIFFFMVLFFVLYFHLGKKPMLPLPKTETITRSYWRGHPKCQFLDDLGEFTCLLTPDDSLALEELETCHARSRWPDCWRRKLPQMHAILIDNSRDPEIVARMAWQWGEMKLDGEVCSLLLDALLPLVINGIEAATTNHGYPSCEHCYEWTLAFDNAVHALVQNNCFSPDVIRYLLRIAETHALAHPIMDDAIKFYVKKGKEPCISELMTWINERQRDLDERRLMLFLSYLAATRSSSAMTVLHSFLTNGESELVKVAAAKCLVDMGTREVFKEMVLIAAHSSSHSVRMMVVEAASSLSGSRFHHFIMLLDDREVDEIGRDFVMSLLTRSELSLAWERHFQWLLKVNDGKEILETELIILKRERKMKDIVKRLSSLKMEK